MPTPTARSRATAAARAARARAGPALHGALRRLGLDIVRVGPADGPPDPELLDVDAATRATVRAVAGYTLTSPERVVALCDAVRYLVGAGVEGAFVECGVWRGGSILAMLRTLLALGVTDRDVHLFDTFDRMPSPGAEDVDLLGVPATRYHAAFDAGEAYDPAYDYLPVEDVRRLLVGTGYPPERLHFHRGLVQDTVPAAAPDRIALLRLDTDYYESTRHELVHLGPRLAPSGVLIVDDYGHWQGSRKATDEHLADLAAAGVHPYLHRIDYSGRLLVMPERASAPPPVTSPGGARRRGGGSSRRQGAGQR